MKYIALRNIKPGEEITINYNWDPKDKTPVGFKIVKQEGSEANEERRTEN